MSCHAGRPRIGDERREGGGQGGAALHSFSGSLICTEFPLTARRTIDDAQERIEEEDSSERPQERLFRTVSGLEMIEFVQQDRFELRLAEEAHELIRND